MAGRPKTRAKKARKVYAKARYDNAGDYIRYKSARAKTYGPVRPELQPRWMGVKPAKKRKSKSSASRSSSTARSASRSTSNRTTGYSISGVSTRGYKGVQGPLREGAPMAGAHGGVGQTALRNVPKKFLAAHLRKLPASLGEGRSFESRHFDGDPDFDYEYGTEYTLRTTCSGGRLTTIAGDETLD